MLKIKTSSKTVSEDYVAAETASGITALSGRHIIGIASICLLSLIIALPYGKLIPESASPLLSIFNEQEKLDQDRQERYATTKEQDVDNIEIAASAGSEENYDDMDIPKNILSNSASDDSFQESTNKEIFAVRGPEAIKKDASAPLVRPRFESINESLALTNKNEPVKTETRAKAETSPELAQSTAIDKIKNIMSTKGINPEESLIANILGTKTPAFEAEKTEVIKRPQGTWYQQTVHKGDTLSQIFNYLNLPNGTLNKITTVAKKKDLRLAKGQVIHFLINKENIVLEMVKPLNKTEQVRFTRMHAKQGFTVVYEKINEHLDDPKLIAKFAQAEEMPLAQEAAAERKKQEEILAKAKAQEQARKAQEAQLALEQEKILEQQTAENLKTRPRLVLGMIKNGETFDKAAKRIGLTKSEIATIKQSFSGKINFKRLTSGDSFRVLTDKIGTRGNITAMEVVSARDGRVILYRNPSNRIFYEEGEYQPTAGAFKRFPITGKIKVNSPFNPRRMHPIRHKIVPHWGVDFKVPVGTPVYAPADGTVKFAGFMRGGGYVVILNHKGGYSTVYMHLSKFDVKKGQTVHMGQVIAKSGNTGYSTGAHLHYELHINGRAIDPLKADLPSGNKAQAQTLRKQFESTVAKLKGDLYKSSLASR